jgi:hypothetical protein
MNYASLWSTLAKRAVLQGGLNADAFLDMAAASGMSPEEVERRLLDDLDNDGPIFGAFMRQLQSAATSSVMAAEQQGSIAAVLDGDAELARLLDIESMDDVIDGADPAMLEAVENAAGRQEFTWVATLVNTCHRCLPLHGHTRTLEEWRALGFAPETIHDGWQSSCHCQLVPHKDAGPRDDLVAPLVRMKAEAPKGVKRTVRMVAQQDLDRAIEATRKAMESEQGRKTLRLLGHSGDVPPPEVKRAAG